jgi:aromatic-L-amino-acid decarboxylase
MKTEEFRKHGHQLIDWIATYYEQIEQYPVKSQVKPGDIYRNIPEKAPAGPEDFDVLLTDFEDKIMPGITHWQHPSFFAYFNANASFPSILGELLTSAISAQCMVWETSPAAAELEERVCEWIRKASGLPGDWHGVIQDTASTATLCALLMAREKYSDFAINKHGFSEGHKYLIYVSSEGHSSIEKGAKIAGFGSEQVIKIPVDDKLAMIPEVLEQQIEKDTNAGLIPLCVVAAVGTTGSHAMDPVRSIGEICKKYGLFFHVDAAHAGNAAILEEYRWMIDGIDLADTYVFNPHKWMFTNFDCSMFYTKDKGTLIRTFEIMPEYLKTENDTAVNNYRDWGIQLGRRFRALKLWFVLRSYGLEGIKAKFREHIGYAKYFADKLDSDPEFELLAPVPLNLVCFRYHPEHAAEEDLNELNTLMEKGVNDSGKAYITHTKIEGKYTLRACIGQTNVEQRHVDALLDLLKEQGKLLKIVNKI